MVTTESERIAALARYFTPGDTSDPAMTTIVQLAAQITGASFTMVNLVGDDFLHRIAGVGVPVCDIPREGTLCTQAVRHGKTINVADAQADSLYQNNPYVDGTLANYSLYASAPLKAPSGEVIGTLCAFDEEPKHLSTSQVEALEGLASQVMVLLQLRQTTVRLHDALDEERRITRSLTLSEDRTRNLLETASDVFVSVDREDRIVAWNLAAAALTGIPSEKVMGRPAREVITDNHWNNLSAAFETAREAETIDPVHLTLPLKRLGVTLEIKLWQSLDDGSVHLMARDVTIRSRMERELRERTLELQHTAHHDALTGLPNRLLLVERLAVAVGSAARGESAPTILFVDLDGFKSVNDTYGHKAGDVVLQEVARRLVAAVRPEDVVARLGGDEFVVVLSDLPRPEDVIATRARLEVAVSTPVDVEGAKVRVGASIGVCSITGTLPAEAVLAEADARMYARKRSR